MVLKKRAILMLGTILILLGGFGAFAVYAGVKKLYQPETPHGTFVFFSLDAEGDSNGYLY